MDYKLCNIDELQDNFFQRIGKQWMLLSCAKDGKFNGMTASWGGVGVLWNKNVFFCFVRPQRYTKKFCDASDIISLSFFPEQYRDALKICGSTSGKDTDKFKLAGLTPMLGSLSEVDFEESEMTIIGRKLYSQDMDGKCFTDESYDSLFYKDRDYHTMYVCEIIEIRKKQL